MNKKKLKSLSGKMVNAVVYMNDKVVKPVELEGRIILSPVQLAVLKLLNANESCAVTELADALDRSRAQISALLETLYKKGLVDRRYDKEDRRMVNVFITSLGREKLNEFDQLFFDHIMKKLSVLSDDEGGRLNKALDELQQIIKSL